jgi:putative addiction module component (TIGR02574 family)
MDVATVLKEIDSWTVEDRLLLIESVWDRMLETGNVPDLTDAQKRELDRRLAALEAEPENVVSWEDVQAHFRCKR